MNAAILAELRDYRNGKGQLISLGIAPVAHLATLPVARICLDVLTQRVECLPTVGGVEYDTCTQERICHPAYSHRVLWCLCLLWNQQTKQDSFTTSVMNAHPEQDLRWAKQGRYEVTCGLCHNNDCLQLFRLADGIACSLGLVGYQHSSGLLPCSLSTSDQSTMTWRLGQTTSDRPFSDAMTYQHCSCCNVPWSVDSQMDVIYILRVVTPAPKALEWQSNGCTV